MQNTRRAISEWHRLESSKRSYRKELAGKVVEEIFRVLQHNEKLILCEQRQTSISLGCRFADFQPSQPPKSTRQRWDAYPGLMFEGSRDWFISFVYFAGLAAFPWHSPICPLR